MLSMTAVTMRLNYTKQTEQGLLVLTLVLLTMLVVLLVLVALQYRVEITWD